MLSMLQYFVGCVSVGSALGGVQMMPPGFFADAGLTVPTVGVSTGPVLASSWIASATQSYGTGTIAPLSGTYFYDGPNQRWRMTGCSQETIFHPDDHMCTDSLSKNISGPMGFNMNMTVGRGSDSVCKVMPMPYYDLFALLATANHTSHGSVEGEPCEIWTADLSGEGYETHMSACVAADGVPREYNMSSNMAYKQASVQKYRFTNVSVGPVDEGAFASSDVCENRYPMPACSHGAEESLDVYRVHSKSEPYSLENRDVGDALGDMAFFCDVVGIDETQLVSHWAVQANSSWGQYAYCLYQGGINVCYGETGNKVGRESALGLGEGSVQGQCSPNTDVGSWLSFPSAGKCPEGSRVGDGGCTWSAQVRRTVSAGCILNERGLKESCAAERSHAPMMKSAAIFKAALGTADPTLGGCPDVDTGHGAVLLV